MQVPAYFDGQQKDAIIRAGTLAGLQTVRLVRHVALRPPPPPPFPPSHAHHPSSQSVFWLSAISEGVASPTADHNAFVVLVVVKEMQMHLQPY